MRDDDKAGPLTIMLFWAVGLLTGLVIGIAVVHGEGNPYEQWVAEGGSGLSSEYNEHVLRVVWTGTGLENWVVRVAWCESTMNAQAVNPAGPYIGLLQIWDRHAPGEDLTDPWVNARVGLLIYERQGPNAWPICQYV